MHKPFFSIIIPTYNAAPTLAACLQSIVQQTMNDWEILIMDSLSKDDTIAIASEFKNNFPNIKIIAEKDKGIYDGMNKGIRMAQGEWLYFLGSDDKLFDAAVLEKMAAFITDSPGTDVVYGNVYSERFKGTYDGVFDITKIRTKNISHQAIFFKRWLFEKTGDFDLKYRSQSDWDHNLKWMLSGQLHNKFIDLIIARYADGGFSSVHGDDVFYADLDFNYIRYGYAKLSSLQKIRILGYQFLKAVKRAEKDRMKKVMAHLRYI
jgi:glycosyltransferase involved in cell wall biosynthesis